MDLAELIKEYDKAMHKRKRAETAYLISRAYINRSEGGYRIRNTAELKIATDYALTAEKLAKETGQVGLEAESIIAQAQCAVYQNNFAETIRIADRAESLLLQADSPEISASWHLVKARALKYSGRCDEALHHENIALELYTSLGKKEYIETAAFNLATSYREMGDYANALRFCSQALLLGLELHSRDTGSHYLELGIVHILLGNHEKSFEYLQQAELFFTQQSSGSGIVGVYQARGNSYCSRGMLKEALETYQIAYKIVKEYAFPIKRLPLSMGDLHQQLGESEQALVYYQQALELAITNNDLTTAAYVRRYIASIYVESTKKYDEAEQLLKQCLDYYHAHFESAPEYCAIYELLSQIEEKRGNDTQALQYFKTYHQWREKVRDHEKEKSLQDIQHRLDIETTAREQVEMKARTAELERSLDVKRGELASMAIALSQKNELIEKLHSKVKELSKLQDISGKDGCKTMIHEIESLRKSGEEQWGHLQKQFESIDEIFQPKLVQRFGSLTKNEIKICLLMRLNLTTKEIANVLWTSPRTIETHRYSIRKKLHLGKDDNLYSFLITM